MGSFFLRVVNFIIILPPIPATLRIRRHASPLPLLRRIMLVFPVVEQVLHVRKCFNHARTANLIWLRCQHLLRPLIHHGILNWLAMYLLSLRPAFLLERFNRFIHV